MDLQALSQHLLSIPAGSISLRDDRKKTQWQVQISPFKLAKVPVTQQLYAQVMGSNPSLICGDTHPVDSVSWLDAIKFCNALSEQCGLQAAYKIELDTHNMARTGGHLVTLLANCDGYRLPTDAEWEYACRAGTNAARYGELDDIAWFERNSGESTQPVGSKQPNAFGLYDMLGNVWEWCWDVYDAQEYQSYRIFRGGGWADAERSVLATNRRRSHPTYAIDDLGFRIAKGPIEVANDLSTTP